MMNWYPFLAVLAVSLTCAYLRTSLKVWTIAGFIALFATGWLAGSHWLAITLTAAAFALITVPLNLPDFRRQKLTAPLLKIYQKITPQLSDTERVAQATHMIVGDRNDAFVAAVRDFIEPLRANGNA